MKRSHHFLLIFVLCSTDNLLGMELVSSTTAFADIAKEKVQIWVQSSRKYAAFYSAVRKSLEIPQQEPPATIAEAAAKKSGLGWPLDVVHREGLAEHGSLWNSKALYKEVPIEVSPISLDYVMMRGRYGIRNALPEEKADYLTAEKSSKSPQADYTSFGSLVDLSGETTPKLCVPYSPNIIFPIQISPSGKYVLALSPNEKSVTLYTEGNSQEPAHQVYSWAANLCNKHFYLTDTHVYVMEKNILCAYDLVALTDGNFRAFSLIKSFDATIGSTAVTPALLASPDENYILIRGTGKKLHIISKQKTLQSIGKGWASMSTIELPQSAERYDIHLLEKIGAFVAIHRSGYCGDTENRHIIGSLKKPHTLQTFWEPSAGKCAVSPCQRYLALTNYYTESIALFEINTAVLTVKEGSSSNLVQQLTTIAAGQLIGWSDGFGAPLFIYHDNKPHAVYSNAVVALLASLAKTA